MGKITNTSDAPRIDWLFGLNPNAIENQEAKGQQELVNSSQLPRIGNFDVKYQYEKMGIKVIGETKGDNLFLDVELPKGWKLKSTEHSMHNDLIDDKGRKRAAIFYKAAFYDRKADISFVKRIDFRVDRLAFLEGNYSLADGEYVGYKTPYVGRVIDFDGKVLFETEHIECDVEYVDSKKGGKYYSDDYKEKSFIIEESLRAKCLKFLSEEYPNYNDFNAYWD